MNKEQFLAMSLPHELKFMVNETKKIFQLNSNHIYNNHTGIYKGLDENCKIILYNLSDLTKPITHKGETFILIDKILESGGFNLSKMSRQEINSYAKPFLMPELISLDDALILIEHHFDIAGLIEKGEAIDVNTLEINPYK